jgi:hypothetical protein
MRFLAVALLAFSFAMTPPSGVGQDRFREAGESCQKESQAAQAEAQSKIQIARQLNARSRR